MSASKPIPLRIPPALLTEIDRVFEESQKRGLDKTKQEIMRDAMELGLKAWESIGYDLAGAAIEKALNIAQHNSADPKKRMVAVRVDLTAEDAALMDAATEVERRKKHGK